MHNILIGQNAGIELTTESYQLRLKGRVKNEKGIYEDIDIQETMSEREYHLISSALKLLAAPRIKYIVPVGGRKKWWQFWKKDKSKLAVEKLMSEYKREINPEEIPDIFMPVSDGIKREMMYCGCETPMKWQVDNYCLRCNGLIKNKI